MEKRETLAPITWPAWPGRIARMILSLGLGCLFLWLPPQYLVDAPMLVQIAKFIVMLVGLGFFVAGFIYLWILVMCNWGIRLLLAFAQSVGAALQDEEK